MSFRRSYVSSPARGLFMLGLAAAASVTVGCFQPEPLRGEQLQQGYILLLPGVECTAESMSGLYHGLREAGFRGAIDVDIWGYHPFGTFRNLPAYELNRTRASRIAAKLEAYKRDHPSAPVSVIGFSGGGAMAVFVAEAMPDGSLLDRVILLGAAISPAYDLSKALERSRCGIVNFYSPHDSFMGGWGTETFGTMDRRKTSAAGRKGFRNEADQLLSAPGLQQVRWRREWARLGHLGKHSGWLSRDWARLVLASQVPNESECEFCPGPGRE